MNQQILKYLRDYSHDTLDVNRLFVSAFLTLNGKENVQNHFIKSYLISEEFEAEYLHLNQFIRLFQNKTFGIEELIEFFEFVISPVDKEINGAVYTPEFIREYIVSATVRKRTSEAGAEFADLTFCDMACGCGGFFFTIAKTIRNETSRTYSEIYKHNIYGLDIQEYSITRTKILLSLAAILDNEDAEVFEFNLYCGDALSFDWRPVIPVSEKSGFDVIVGNPPYVGVTKMSNETRRLMKKWQVSLTGKPDLYIPFFEIGIENLNSNGVLGYITVNTFFKSLNGRLLRKYFSLNNLHLSILDFGGEQVFKNRSTYTCVCIIAKESNPGIDYLKIASAELPTVYQNKFSRIDYAELDDYTGWHLVEKSQHSIINKMENTGVALGKKFLIRNGFATLKNDVFIFTPDKH